MKQKFDVTGMTCAACSEPHGMDMPRGPRILICAGEMNSPGIKGLLRKPLGRATGRGMGGADWA